MKGTNRDDAASVIAAIFGLSDRAVRMVINGETENERVLEAVIDYRQGKQNLIEQLRQKVSTHQQSR